MRAAAAARQNLGGGWAGGWGLGECAPPDGGATEPPRPELNPLPCLSFLICTLSKWVTCAGLHQGAVTSAAPWSAGC